MPTGPAPSCWPTTPATRAPPTIWRASCGDSGGKLEGAEAAFARANELGRLPQPGLALLRLAQGRADQAVPALRSTLRPGPIAPLPRALLLAALVEAAIAADELDVAAESAGELTEVANRSGSELVIGYAHSATAQVLMAQGAWTSALTELRAALQVFLDLGQPYEAARQRARLGAVALELGDRDTARLELQTALAAFERLGAEPDRRGVHDMWANPLVSGLGGDEPKAATSAGDHPPLTGRELEVLALVAAGSTNREIAEHLVLSPHTVARHVSNIMAKLGVGSRAAATALAYRAGLIT
jgi:DNA-binding NarL/FixJ family response regulator